MPPSPSNNTGWAKEPGEKGGVWETGVPESEKPGNLVTVPLSCGFVFILQW